MVFCGFLVVIILVIFCVMVFGKGCFVMYWLIGYLFLGCFRKGGFFCYLLFIFILLGFFLCVS